MSLLDSKALRIKLKKQYQEKTWYTVRSLLGNQWANWFCLIGARERGKSFSVQEYCLTQFFNPKSKLYHKPFYWLRLNEIAVKNMLMNNGAKMFEPLLHHSFNLYGMKVRGDSVFIPDPDNKDNMLLLCYVWGLSVAYNNKGAAIFNKKNFTGANIIIDKIALEKGQKKTFDLVYNIKMQVENIVRSERDNVRIFMIMNNTSECPALSMFNYIPLEWGVYKLKRKHCVMDYIPNTEAYEARRKNALANEIDNGTGNFTNKMERDISLIYKGRLVHPTSIIKFSKDSSDWFTLWDGQVIALYNNERRPSIAMRRHIDEVFNSEAAMNVVEMSDARAFHFKDLMAQVRFVQALSEIKPR